MQSPTTSIVYYHKTAKGKIDDALKAALKNLTQRARRTAEDAKESPFSRRSPRSSAPFALKDFPRVAGIKIIEKSNLLF